MRHQAVGWVLAAACAAAGSGAAAENLCVPGRAVSVLHGGKWYAAKVLKGPDAMGTCLVAYDGYGSNWDEWVNPSRMRPAAAAAATPTPRPGAPRGVQPGKYACYTFDGGQLQYTYTDVVITSGNGYAVGKDRGTFTLGDGGALRFTGKLANATGRYSVKANGTAQIDLVFNGDRRASMACARKG